MTKCNAEWQIQASFTGVLKQYVWPISVATCGLERYHEGKHRARTRSPVNNAIANIEW